MILSRKLAENKKKMHKKSRVKNMHVQVNHYLANQIERQKQVRKEPKPLYCNVFLINLIRSFCTGKYLS